MKRLHEDAQKNLQIASRNKDGFYYSLPARALMSPSNASLPGLRLETIGQFHRWHHLRGLQPADCPSPR